jgi:hypothetical protein
MTLLPLSNLAHRLDLSHKSRIGPEKYLKKHCFMERFLVYFVSCP